MLFVRYLTKLFSYATAIIAVCALAGLALLSIWLPIYFGIWGFFPAIGIWLGTIVAANHVVLSPSTDRAVLG